MATTFNSASQFAGDITPFIAAKTLPLARRQLVVYQFGDPATLPKGMGTTYTASRYIRVPLPFAPLSEGVPPVGQSMTLQQVSAQAQQWGDKITISDVAEMTIKHPLFKKAIELMALQLAETLERNTFNNLMGGSQINYVNSRGSRTSLVAGDVINPHEINRATAMLENIGAPRFDGDEITDMKLEANAGGAKASNNPRKMPHYVAVMHPFVLGDFRENSTVVTAWSYSDLNRLYNYEAGEWGGIRFCRSNMVPWLQGNGASPTGTAPLTTGGTLAAGAYVVTIVGQDIQNQYEQQIYSVSGAVTTITTSTTSFSLALPSKPGYTFTVYISQVGGSTTNNIALLGTSSSSLGPQSGPLVGAATQLAGGQTVSIGGIGPSQFPPAAPTSGVIVYPTFIFGRGAYAQVVLDNAKFTYLKEADKSDPLNQLRVVGWKNFYGTLISNAQFMMRIESTSAFNTTFG
jgi:N4-gp56 family major capsid protein